MEINGELKEKQGGRSFGDGIAAVGDRVLDVVERIVDRYRLNVVTLAVMVFFLVKDFGDKLLVQLNKSTDTSGEAIIGILGILIGTGVGGLIALMMRLIETPSVPVENHERIIVETQREASKNTRMEIWRELERAGVVVPDKMKE